MYLVEGRLAGVVAALLIAAAGVVLGGAGPDFGTHAGAAAPAAAVSAAATHADATPCAPAAQPPA